MALHLIKLAVGATSIRDLEEWVEECLRVAGEQIHTTRTRPKRDADVLDGGSLYWVIKGQLCCRQRITDLRDVVDGEGIPRCEIVLEPKVAAVAPRPYRAFQGWRYLEPKDAPADLGGSARGLAEMPEDLRRELTQLGLL